MATTFDPDDIMIGDLIPSRFIENIKTSHAVVNVLRFAALRWSDMVQQDSGTTRLRNIGLPPEILNDGNESLKIIDDHGFYVPDRSTGRHEKTTSRFKSSTVSEAEYMEFENYHNFEDYINHETDVLMWYNGQKLNSRFFYTEWRKLDLLKDFLFSRINRNISAKDFLDILDRAQRKALHYSKKQARPSRVTIRAVSSPSKASRHVVELTESEVIDNLKNVENYDLGDGLSDPEKGDRKSDSEGGHSRRLSQASIERKTKRPTVALDSEESECEPVVRVK